MKQLNLAAVKGLSLIFCDSEHSRKKINKNK